jgi:FkbM family methyltransferase
MDRARMELTGFRTERGLLWPDYDRRCAEVTFGETDTALPAILAHVPGRRVVVQAGGNCGPLVRLLAPLFGAVYTFEPDPLNFVALTVNTAEFRNVHRYQAVLGVERGRVGLAQGDVKFPANCGALYAHGAGTIPRLRIDDLGLEVCDLVLLDIEGAEAQAIDSGRATIRAHRPVVVIESKGLGERFFGEAPALAEQMLNDFGYQRAAKIKADLVMVPR